MQEVSFAFNSANISFLLQEEIFFLAEQKRTPAKERELNTEKSKRKPLVKNTV